MGPLKRTLGGLRDDPRGTLRGAFVKLRRSLRGFSPGIVRTLWYSEGDPSRRDP